VTKENSGPEVWQPAVGLLDDCVNRCDAASAAYLIFITSHC